MASKNSTAVKVFERKIRGLEYDQADYVKTMEKVTELAKNPSPNNRYEIAQIVGYVVDNMLAERVDFIEKIADTKYIPMGAKAQFKTKVKGIKAFIQAKGSTTERSQIAHEYVTLDTYEVSARPVINFTKLASGEQTIEDVVMDAVIQMELVMTQHIENVLLTAYRLLSSPNYASGTGLVKADLNLLVRTMGRFGRPVILGDIDMTSQLAELTGFQAATSTDQFAESIINEQNTNGYVGSYLGGDVNLLANAYDGDSLEEDDLVLNNKVLYIMPGGLAKDNAPLKVVFEGDMRSYEAQNIDDESFEIALRKNFGAGVIGAQKLMAIYEDATV